MDNENEKPNIVTDPDKFTAEELRAHIAQRLDGESEPQAEMDRLIGRLGELPLKGEVEPGQAE